MNDSMIDDTINKKIQESEERVLKALNAKVCCTCRKLKMIEDE